MTSTERVHRFRAKHRTGKPQTKHETKQLEAEIAALKQRIAELERRGEGQLTRSRREEFGEVGKFGGENAKRKSRIIKLKGMQEEADAAKLRKQVIDQRVEMASMRQIMKKIAKERDKYQVRTKLKYREARRLLIRQNHNVIIKALHVDRDKSLTAEEIAEARR